MVFTASFAYPLVWFVAHAPATLNGKPLPLPVGRKPDTAKPAKPRAVTAEAAMPYRTSDPPETPGSTCRVAIAVRVTDPRGERVDPVKEIGATLVADEVAVRCCSRTLWPQPDAIDSARFSTPLPATSTTRPITRRMSLIAAREHNRGDDLSARVTLWPRSAVGVETTTT